ncbi:MAG: DUF5367 family protein [Acidobacteria bacterium]|nr:DUF5367 family protein [Acidobacteriota bacterium]
MKAREVIVLLAVGLAIWIVGTIYYAHTGRSLLESSPRRYWLAFAASSILSAAICMGVVRWRKVAYADWALAMLLLAIPGMIGEAVVLTHWQTFMPGMQASSGGKYGAFLFATYAVVLGLAEAVSLLARR